MHAISCIQFLHILQPAHPAWFIESIRSILSSPLEAPSKSPIRFEFSEAASLHNSNLLASFECDISKPIDAFPETELSYGSEFRPVHMLEPLFKQRKNWPRMKDFISNGFAPEFDQSKIRSVSKTIIKH